MSCVHCLGLQHERDTVAALKATVEHMELNLKEHSATIQKNLASVSNDVKKLTGAAIALMEGTFSFNFVYLCVFFPTNLWFYV